MLVICDDPAESVDMTRAYNVGVNLSIQMPFRRIAIVLTGAGVPTPTASPSWD